mmetsp:Transcript_67893/g.107679  ORF Transcript_67893/g.107679 Transcript_67893/m.107679 type:complete len:267 (-) Transcript_67893:7-807(-)
MARRAQLPYSMACLARDAAKHGSCPLVISEMALAQRPEPLSLSSFSSVSREFSAEQLKALERLRDYPRRMERLRQLWADLQTGNQTCGRQSPASRPSSGGSTRSRSCSQLRGAGASMVGSGGHSYKRVVGRHSAGCKSGRHRSTSRSYNSTAVREVPRGPLTAAQIRELMSRDITPEDYELLCLLDEGIKKAPTISSSLAASLPRVSGSACIGEDCRICFCPFEEGEDIISLPGCAHMFHGPCAEQWLASYKATCPLCGNEIPGAA